LKAKINKLLILIPFIIILLIAYVAKYEPYTYYVTIKPWIYNEWQDEKVFDDLIIKQNIEKITLGRIESSNSPYSYLVDIVFTAKYYSNGVNIDSARIKQRIVFVVWYYNIIDWWDLPQMRIETLVPEIES